VSITVGFSTHGGLLSWLIRKATRSPASHAWILYDDPTFGERMVLESTALGFHLSPFDGWSHHNRVVEVFDFEAPLSDGLKAVTQFLGERYDVGGLLGMPIVLLGRWMRRKWLNPFRSSKAVFCSEAVVRTLQGARVAGSLELDPEGTSPGDLLEFCQRTGRKRE